jgi:hypothetical protein
MIFSRAVFAILLTMPTVGCGLQLGAGWQPSTPPDRFPVVLTSGFRAHGVRRVAPMAGGQVSFVNDGRERAIHLRNARALVGVHLPAVRPFPLGFGGEVAWELGVGEPAFQEFHGVGAYAGANAALLYRLVGSRDLQPTFDVAMTHLDLVLATRAGAWSAPEFTRQPPSVWEVGFDLALRFTIESDVLNAAAQVDR